MHFLSKKWCNNLDNASGCPSRSCRITGSNIKRSSCYIEIVYRNRLYPHLINLSIWAENPRYNNNNKNLGMENLYIFYPFSIQQAMHLCCFRVKRSIDLTRAFQMDPEYLKHANQASGRCSAVFLALLYQQNCFLNFWSKSIVCQLHHMC